MFESCQLHTPCETNKSGTNYLLLKSKFSCVSIFVDGSYFNVKVWNVFRKEYANKINFDETFCFVQNLYTCFCNSKMSL